MLGSARTGENRIHDILKKYGKEKIKQFVTEWFDYSEKRMRKAIGELPAATIERENFHDPMPPILPDGIPVRVKLTVDPKEGSIEIDLTSNIDNTYINSIVSSNKELSHLGCRFGQTHQKNSKGPGGA